jgi:2-polyprenyl-3-methyl-5-hydroxy-6-metoxy-1,4-benzoquinol methylase
MKTNELVSEPQIDFSKVEAFAGLVLTDMSAAMASTMTQIGHKAGLYKAMSFAGPITVDELVEKANLDKRYVQEWVNCQAAGGYVIYHAEEKKYELPVEHAMVLAVDESPAFMASGFDVVSSVWLAEEKLLKAFKSGNGIAWKDHHQHLFYGVEAFYRTGYRAHLVNDWIPALDGIDEKLDRGTKVADVGCGHGASTIIMAKAYPNSTFFGFDTHKESIEVARFRAREANVNNAIFQLASASSFPGKNYDLICMMDAFHDLGDPKEAAKHMYKTLSTEGSLMLVEPISGDVLEDNFNIVGRMFYAGSTALCVAHSKSEGGSCLGAQAGKSKIENELRAGSFRKIRVATTSQVNMIIEAKK